MPISLEGLNFVMGHERVGNLPKSQKWRDIVSQLASLYESDIEVSDVVKNTLDNVRFQYRKIQYDKNVLKAFKFLVAIALSSRTTSNVDLASLGIKISENPTPLTLTKAFQNWMETKQGSLEYSQIAQNAVVDVIAIWYEENKTKQEQLFKSNENLQDIWKKAGNGSGFCELSRLFFSKFTERYLNYFLEREASSSLSNEHERENFKRDLGQHLDEISLHAFETSKITQSFAAGWFNNCTKQGMPKDNQIKAFLSIAFGKIREELRREGEVV